MTAEVAVGETLQVTRGRIPTSPSLLSVRLLSLSAIFSLVEAVAGTVLLVRWTVPVSSLVLRVAVWCYLVRPEPHAGAQLPVPMECVAVAAARSQELPRSWCLEHDWRHGLLGEDA